MMRSLRFFWKYITYRKDLLVLMLTVSAVVTAAELYIPWIVMRAIDAVVEQRSMEQLNAWAIQGLILVAGFYVLHAVMIRIDAQLILRCSYNLRRRLYAHIIGQGLPFFERYQTGELIHRAVTDTEAFDEDIEDLFSELPFDFLTIIGVTVFMAILDVKMAIFVVIFMAINAAFAWYLGRPLLNLEKSIQSSGARLTARFQESVAGIRTVQSFANEDVELSRLDVDNREILKKELKEGKIESVMEPMADAMTMLGLVLVVWYGGAQIIAGNLTIGALVAFIAYMEILAEPLEELEGYYRDYLGCRAMAERIQDLFDEDEAVADDGELEIGGDRIEIAFEGVAFSYESRKKGLVEGITFAAHPGEVLAIVGRNGAGKSTLLNLLQRFYDPDEGQIKANGADLRQYDLNGWRRSVGVMSQDTFLFHGSILDNIAYGNPEADAAQVMEAARTSGLTELADKFSNGLDTIVGERGSRVSGGERQRISLARLFLNDPKLVLLDEPTAHLDGEALHGTLDSIRELTKTRTTIVVSHHLELVEQADRVIFLESGAISAEGTHEDLLSSNRAYRALWKNQMPRETRVQRMRRNMEKRIDAQVPAHAPDGRPTMD
ncbi:ABC transporter ATP-binding protein [Hoeflea sp. TYP-13]|uniref:ABC transporter ATP-binding protein n=1 Tax=Hoeflea sp. TYP-13 TaxID=3230023 RepID=UPI0034C5E44B